MELLNSDVFDELINFLAFSIDLSFSAVDFNPFNYLILLRGNCKKKNIAYQKQILILLKIYRFALNH